MMMIITQVTVTWFVYRLTIYGLVFRCLHGLAPAYLAEAFNRAADVESRCRLRSGSSSAIAAVLLVTVLLQSREHVCGTAYQPH